MKLLFRQVGYFQAVLLALVAVLLCTPSLDIGLFLDDHIHQASLLHPGELTELHTSPNLLFSFVSEHRDPLRPGLPWWTSDDLKLSFWRPVAGLSHALDHRLWPESPWLMHLHSLLWLGLTVFLASLAYGRFLNRRDGVSGAATGPAWVAILAALFFAVDDVHSWPAMWIANRNALLSMCFGLAALIAHDRLRRDGWAAGLWVSPLCLLLGVLSGESAVSCGAYLGAYALFLDPRPGLAGLRALGPNAVTGAVWLAIYKLQGFGAGGSGAYIDPLADPLRFVAAATERIPMLMLGLWSPLPADLYLLLPADARRTLLIAALLFASSLGIWMVARLAGDPRARFLALGCLGSLVPASIVLPMNRQLLFVSFGAMGLIAMLVGGEIGGVTGQVGQDGRRGLGAKILVAPLLIFHLVMAPLALLTTPFAFQSMTAVIERAVRSLPADPELELVVVLHAPGHVFTSGAKIFRTLEGLRTPPLLTASTSLGAVRIERLDARTLRIRPDSGFCPAPSGAERRAGEPLLNPLNPFVTFDSLFFNPAELPSVGTAWSRDEVEIRLVETDDKGFPQAAEFRFEEALESTAYGWVRWEDGVFVPVGLPAVGESVELGPAALPMSRAAR